MVKLAQESDEKYLRLGENMNVRKSIFFIFILLIGVDSSFAQRRRVLDPSMEITTIPIEPVKLEIDCGPRPPGLIQEFSVECFNKKVSKRDRGDKSQLQLLQGELDVCECLDDHPRFKIKRSAINIKIQTTDAYITMRDYEKNLDGISRRLASQRNGMMFQTSTLSENPNFAAEYNSGKAAEELTTMLSNTRGRGSLNNLRGQSVDAAKNALDLGFSAEDRENKRQINEGISEALKNFKVPEANENLLKEEVFAEGQCISSREYLAFRQLPSDGEFYKFVSTHNFNEKDWDYSQLERELRDLTRGTLEERRSRKDQILSIKSRMRFLNRNPMLKNLFAANKNDNEAHYQNANFSREKKAIWDNHTAWTSLGSNKAKLFDLIKGLSPDKNCDMRKPECLSSASIQKKVQDYRNGLANLFSQKDVVEMTKMEAEKDMFREVASIGSPDMFNIPEKAQSLEDAERLFAQSRPNNVAPIHCEGMDVDVEKCEISYGSFCKQVRDAYRNASDEDGNMEDLGFNLGLDYMDNFNPDIKTNASFKNFNDEICNSERMNQNTNPISRSTFKDFSENYCRTNASAPICREKSAENTQALRTLFLDKFPSRPSDNPMFEAVKITAFNQFIKNNEIPKIDSNVVRNIVNARSETTRSQGNLISGESFINNPGRLSSSTPVITKPSKDLPSSTVASSSSSTFESATVANDSFVNSALSSSVIAPQSFIEKVSQQEVTSEDDRERIRSMAEEEISRTKREAASATDQLQRDNLESRMKFMEQLLAQKTENESKYQQLIDQLNKKLDNQASPQVANHKASTEAEEKKVNKAVSNSFNVDSETQNRAPANINENVTSYTTAGSTAGTASVSGSNGTKAMSGRGASSFNSALLEAQESKAGKVQKSADGSIVIASDANSPALQAMGSAANSVSDYSLSVPAQDYAGFEAQNMETLKRYQEKLLGSMESNQPVRVFVKAANKEPLEFYVVKDGDRLFFKPVRKTGATLEALKEVVKKNP